MALRRSGVRFPQAPHLILCSEIESVRRTLVAQRKGRTHSLALICTVKRLFARHWQDYSIRAKGLIVLSAPLIAAIVSSLLFFIAKAKNDDAKNWVRHTFEVKEQAQRVVTYVLESETGMRGYLLTKDRSFLAAHDEALATLPVAVLRLQELTADNPHQQKRIRESLRPLLQRRLALETDAMLAFSSHERDAGLTETIRHGGAAMHELRAAMDEFIGAEDLLLAERQRRALELDRLTSFAILGATVFGLCVGLGAMLLFARGIARRLIDIVRQTEVLQLEKPMGDPPSGDDEIGRLGRACHHASKLLSDRRDELIRAKTAAEASNAAKTDFLANVSHEVRTPLNGIIGLTSLALETKLTSTQRDYLDMVKHSADSLLTLINEILDLAKIEAGKMVLEERSFDLSDMVDKTIGPLCTRAESKGLLLRANMTPDVPRFITGDSLRLRQVLINLIDNAIKFTHEGSITLDLCSRTTSEGEYELQFVIADTGIGIAKDKQKVIFESFSQADSSTTRNYGGTGLGLTICSDLVRLMGGRLLVESVEGHGSIFRFTIAVRDSEPLPASPSEESTADRSPPILSMRLLVVEDNPVNQSVACGILGKMGHRVTTAVNGCEAVALTQDRQFDAVLMDIQMPEMDGFTATARIREREQEHGSRTPIVAMTAHAGEGDRERCLSAGMDDYVSKPISREKLVDALNRVLHNDAETTSKTSVKAATGRFTYRDLLEKVEGDEELFDRVSHVFVTTTPLLLEQLSQQFGLHDFVAACRGAHTLRGSLANIGATEASRLAAKLEELARNKLSQGVDDLLHELHYQLDSVLAELGRSHLKSAAS